MTPKTKDTFLKLLRDPKAKQVKHAIKDGDSHCVIGLLLDHLGCLIGENVDYYGKLAGMTRDNMESYIGITKPEEVILVNMNNSGKTFAEIADYIEATY